MAFPPKVTDAMGVEANSDPTKTTTIRLGAAVPIEAAVYVATLDEADTPAGLAVWTIETAILTS